MNKHALEFRERFLTVLQQPEYNNINAIYFSGGVDSATILFAMLELDKRPDLVSFELANIPSPDRKIGEDIAKYYGLKYTCMTIPSDKDGVVNDIKTVLPYLKYPMKTHIQCSIPFLHMSKELSKNGYSSAFAGIAADTIHGLNKKCNIALKEMGEEYVRALRFNELYNNPKKSCYDIYRVSELYGNIKILDPYRDKYLTDWMLQIPLKELHTTRSKSIAVDAFVNYWLIDEKTWYRARNNLQVVSGVRELHDNLLLQDTSLNPDGNVGVIAVYNRLIKQLNSNALEEFL